MKSSTRLPPLSTALALICTSLELQRDIQGMEWCVRFGIGGVRKKMGHPVAPDADRPIEVVRDQARTVLAGLCKECSHRECSMKKW